MVEILLDYYFYKFKIQKCGQIFCAHKPYFLMLDHIHRLKSIMLLNLWLLEIRCYSQKIIFDTKVVILQQIITKCDC